MGSGKPSLLVLGRVTRADVPNSVARRPPVTDRVKGLEGPGGRRGDLGTRPTTVGGEEETTEPSTPSETPQGGEGVRCERGDTGTSRGSRDRCSVHRPRL